MSDRIEIVARAIAKVIITKNLEASVKGRMDGLAKIVAVNEAVEAVWPDLRDEANAAINALEKALLDG